MYDLFVKLNSLNTNNIIIRVSSTAMNDNTEEYYIENDEFV